ncbi:hypothetical protein PC110_g4409 [Phytophthora cactorum]|uniref:Uncharacterized protein n=1 Tax=Phytophthora cactorum TaxID=29920 RepID=A0A329STV7_9STRA|nr:hypothetical protein PC115_g5375 [Phytophthora cactorum]KAG3079097.1 hypothetical protein PC121_g7091 [Phytophthora cactorum]KAG3181536.1 hypothetical protein C6341_g6347 [Phytophthora cactorum]KAG4060032.1 hypothetical protein PC123_g5037 [Phytophthora cactorum]RAW39336.1 hypothetical protein PC110_g4409 [Phytophthora cactorum]
MGIATVVTAADAQQGKENMGVTFAETIEHLGGLPVLGGAVLLLALAYIALVEWLMPRGRRLHQFKGTRRQKKTARKRE